MSISTTSRAILQGARDIIDPAGAEKRKKEAEEQKARDALRRMDLRWMMADVRGRRIMSELLARGHLLSPTSSSDRRLHDQADGRREMILGLFFDLMQAAPNETLALFKEHPAIQRLIDASRA